MSNGSTSDLPNKFPVLHPRSIKNAFHGAVKHVKKIASERHGIAAEVVLVGGVLVALCYLTGCANACTRRGKNSEGEGSSFIDLVIGGAQKKGRNNIEGSILLPVPTKPAFKAPPFPTELLPGTLETPCFSPRRSGSGSPSTASVTSASSSASSPSNSRFDANELDALAEVDRDCARQQSARMQQDDFRHSDALTKNRDSPPTERGTTANAGRESPLRHGARDSHRAGGFGDLVDTRLDTTNRVVESPSTFQPKYYSYQHVRRRSSAGDFYHD